MKSLSASIVSAALLVAGVAAQSFQINTPNPPTQCVPVQFTWSGGTPPYFLAIAPGGVPGAAAFQQYSGLTGTSFTWSTNLTAGTSFGLTLTDSNGQVAQSAPVTVASGPESGCLNGQTTTAAGGSTTGAGTSTTSPATGATTTGAGTTTGGGSSTTKPAGSSTGSTSTTSPAATGGSGNNGAFSNTVSAALVGVLGAAAAALLA